MKKSISYKVTMFVNGDAVRPRHVSNADIVRNFWRLAATADRVDCEVYTHDDYSICDDYGAKPDPFNGRVEYYYTASLWNEFLSDDWDIELEVVAEHYMEPEA